MKNIRQLILLSILSVSLWSCSSYTEKEINSTIATADSLKENATSYWKLIQQNDSIILADMNDFLAYGKETGFDPMITQKLQVKVSELKNLSYEEPINIPSFKQVGDDDAKIDLLISDIFAYLSALPDSTMRLSVLAFKVDVDGYYYEQLVGIRTKFSNTSKEYNDFIVSKEDVLGAGDYDLTPIKNFFATTPEDLEEIPEEK